MSRRPRNKEKQKVITFIDARDFTDTNAYNSSSFYCEPYDNMLVEIYMPDTTGAPTDMLIDLEWSDDNSTFYKDMTDYWGDLRYEDTAAPYTESVRIPVLAPYVRFTATSQGAGASDYFTLTIKGIFSDK